MNTIVLLSLLLLTFFSSAVNIGKNGEAVFDGLSTTSLTVDGIALNADNVNSNRYLTLQRDAIAEVYPLILPVNYTLEFWFKLNEPVESASVAAILTYTCSTGDNCLTFVVRSNWHLAVVIGRTEVAVHLETPILAGHWHHVAFAFGAGVNHRVFIDFVERLSVPPSISNEVTSGGRLVLTQEMDGSVETFVGLAADMSFDSNQAGYISVDDFTLINSYTSESWPQSALGICEYSLHFTSDSLDATVLKSRAKSKTVDVDESVLFLFTFNISPNEIGQITSLGSQGTLMEINPHGFSGIVERTFCPSGGHVSRCLAPEMMATQKREQRLWASKFNSLIKTADFFNMTTSSNHLPVQVFQSLRDNYALMEISSRIPVTEMTLCGWALRTTDEVITMSPFSYGDNAVHFNVNSGQGKIFYGINKVHQGYPFVMESNRWYHIGATWNKSTGDAKLYIDGVHVDTFVAASTIDLHSTSSVVTIANEFDGSTPSDFWKGYVSGVGGGSLMMHISIMFFNKEMSAEEMLFIKSNHVLYSVNTALSLSYHQRWLSESGTMSGIGAIASITSSSTFVKNCAPNHWPCLLLEDMSVDIQDWYNL